MCSAMRNCVLIAIIGDHSTKKLPVDFKYWMCLRYPILHNNDFCFVKYLNLRYKMLNRDYFLFTKLLSDMFVASVFLVTAAEV